MKLAARWILPISTPPIENGWVEVEDGIIVGIGSEEGGWRGEGSVMDLGDSVLLPGLVNCHAHLEFDRSDHPSDSFAAWAQSVQEGERPRKGAEIAETWERNLKRLVETGTTTVVNHGNQIPLPTGGPPQAEQDPLPEFPHMIQVCEIVGSSPERAAKSYQEACEQRLALLESDLIEETVVCPTSLYAVSPVVWENFLTQRNSDDLLSIHYKESSEENKLFQKGTGALAKLVKEKGGVLWQSNPMRWLQEKGLLGPKTLLIHGNYLTEEEISALQGSRTSVIHSPGSHAYFGHQRFPLEELLEREINVALGTDSLASNQELSMLEEMRTMHKNYPQLSFAQIVEMATLKGAKALGLEGKQGSLEVGKEADIIAVKMAHPGQSPWEAIQNAKTVNFIMIGDGWRGDAFRPVTPLRGTADGRSSPRQDPSPEDNNGL